MGLASVQLRRSISCLPSLMQTSLCPRQSVHPLPSLPGSLPSTRALDEPDIWHGWTQCESAGELSRTRQRCAATSPSLGMKGAPRCRLPAAPLPSPWEQLPPAPAPHRSSPMTDIFPCTEARKLPLPKPALPQMHSVTWFSLLPTPVLPTTAPLATSLLEACLSQEPASPAAGKEVVQTKPLLVPFTAGNHPDPAAGRGHTMALCCPGTASPHAKQTGLVALGRVDAELVPPAQTCHQRDPAAHPESFGKYRGDCPQATGLCTPLRQGTHCWAHPAVPAHPSGWGCSDLQILLWTREEPPKIVLCAKGG